MTDAVSTLPSEPPPAPLLTAIAILPFGAMAMPEGCLPALTVAMTFGGLAFRSITKILSSGTFFQPEPSGSGFIELAISAISPEGWIAILVGGPTIVLISGKVVT